MRPTITRRGLVLPKTYRHECNKARDDLTVAPIPTNAAPRPLRFPVYIELPDALIVPLYWARQALPQLVQEARDIRPSFVSINHPFCGNLRDDLGQLEAVEKTLDSLRTCGGAVLSLAVGHGKTCCALNIACTLGAKTIILVHKQFLADQWASRIRQFIPTANISFVQGDVCDTSGDFVIAMVQTLLSRKYEASIFEACGLLVFDEAHHVAARVFCQTMFSLNCHYTLGLTATPTRRDGLERLIHHFLGPMSYSKSLQVQTKAQVHVIRYNHESYATQPPVNVRGDVDYTKILTLMSQNADRTAFIVNIIRTELADKDVLVLSHRRAHCEALVKGLQAHGLDAALYVGGIKEIPTSKIIVSSYAYVSEGFDEPRLEALVLTTPASDVAQTIGRILRGNSPTREPCIYDIVDCWGVCFAQASKRRKQYLAAGFVINQR